MKLLITGAGSVMGQSIYRALAAYKSDTAIEIHFANSDELAAGRYFCDARAPVVATPILPLARDETYLDVLRSYVDRHKIDLVFSGTQHEIEKISRLRDETGRAATFSSALTDLTLDKLRLNHALRGQGIRLPRDQRLSDYIAQPLIEGPVIIKPIQSSSSRSIYRVGASSGSSPTLAEMIGQIGEARLPEFMVQEMLQGDEFTCGCYVDRYTAEVSVIVLRRTLTADGASGFGEVVADQGIETYVRHIAHALRHHGLDFGHFNAQLILARDGPFLFEINGRLSSTEAPKAMLGFNSAGAFVDNIVLERAARLGPVPIGRRFLRYYDEVYF